MRTDRLQRSKSKPSYMTNYSLPSSSKLCVENSSQRPKLLYLARSFPPAIAPACVRTWNSAKYLSRLGWEVTVVTPEPSVWRKLENSEKVNASLECEGIQRILTDHNWRCLAPDYLTGLDHGLGWLAGGICRKIAHHLRIDSGIGWVRRAEKACSHLTGPMSWTIVIRGLETLTRLGNLSLAQ